MGDAMGTSTAAGGFTAKRPLSEALEIASAVDLEVVKEHALWWNPGLRPQVGARHSSAADGGGWHSISMGCR